MFLQVINGHSNVLRGFPGKEGIFILQILQSLVMDSGGKISLQGKSLTNSFHILSQPSGIRMDENGR